MGPTGSGKSNFINHLTGNIEQRKARNLKSDTESVTPYPISYDGLRLVLVDTPGFDDTYRQDTEILRVIANWLIQKYPDGTTLKIAGIIYFHRITDNRMSGSAYKNLQMFGRLCGNVPLPRTRLVTTMWDIVKDQAVATQRENQLKGDFWRMLIDGGATTLRFNNTHQSASGIVKDLLSMGKDGDELLLQEELVEQQKRLNETEAGKVLYSRLQKVLTEQRRMLQELTEGAKLQNDPALAKSLQEEYNKIDAQLQKTFEEIKELKIPLSRRILLWLFRRKSRAVSPAYCLAPTLF
ncbi:P-loop containing nucleoside triphosphate hydrolase protein [Boletus coccyginus]|nr:P-loop containing nucleoside triphosphate hydrolase protein [Boletus coccyginus]